MFKPLNINKLPFITSTLSAAILLAVQAIVHAGDQTIQSSETAVPDNTRYGLFGLLDHRSAYGQGLFPEPFLVDESELETGEFKVDWMHSRAGNLHSDFMKAEVEKSFGLVTVEVEVPYEWDRDTTAGASSSVRGFDNVDLGARLPVFQYVSRNGLIDETVGVGIEVGIPTNSIVSKNTELVPKLLNDLRIGEHFTVQTVLGYSQLFGTGDEGGLETFEYGFVFGYSIPHKELPLPGVQRVIPVFELQGETELNKDDPGHNSLLGNAGVRVNLDAIGPIQPRVGAGFVFPIDKGAREDVHWGIITSLAFEF